MRLLGNIIWLLFGGFLVAMEYLLSSLLLFITIIGIPFGMQTIKLTTLALWPFGAKIETTRDGYGCLSTIMNIIWLLLGGFLIVLSHLVLGVLFCITIIGIPFGKQHFKLAAIALTPFGRTITYL